MTNHADQGYLLLGCLYIRKQLDALAQHTQGARTAEDVEDVHQARVASRRLRAALVMFGDCFPTKQSRQWQKQIRRLTKGLGAARDLDVQLLSLEARLAALDGDQRRYRPGIQRLHLRLSQARTEVQPRVVKVIDKLDHSQVLSAMVGEIARLLFLLQSRAVTVETEEAKARCCGFIQPRIDELFDWETSLADANEIHGHHQMRIAAKKLRYTLEICNPSFGKELTPIIKQVKRLQTLLGDIHDCDVWADQIGAFIIQERQKAIDYYGHDRPYRTLSPGLTFLQNTHRDKREQLFGELVVTWEQTKTDGLWERLQQTLYHPPPVSPPAPDETIPPVTENTTDDTTQDPPHTDSPIG